MKNAPDFLGIGLQKAGTSWLYEQLSRHPEIWMPKRKELHFFDTSLNEDWNLRRQRRARKRLLEIANQLMADGENESEVDFSELEEQVLLSKPDNDLAWYSSIWSKLSPVEKVAGEITPAYSIIEEETIRVIKEELKVPKVILLLRDPVERAWSQYKMMTERKSNDPDKVYKKKRLLERGNVERILNRWESHYKEDELFIGFFEEIREDPHGLLARICGFLDVKYESALFPYAASPVRVSRDEVCPDHIQSFFVEHYTKDLIYLANRFGGYPRQWALRYGVIQE